MGKVVFTIQLPDWLHNFLRRVKRSVVPKAPPSIDLSGDRDIEWSFIASRLPSGPGEALDFGCGFGNLSLLAAQRGWHITAVDLLAYPLYWQHPNFRFIQGDLLKLDLPVGNFDFIINCSAVEHVGLSGRYGVSAQETDGDVAAMRKMRDLLRRGGTMLLTVPAGRDAVVIPLHRVYGETRLPRLLEGFELVEQHYWRKDSNNNWASATRQDALSYEPTGDNSNPSKCSYALACFVLKKNP